MAVPGRIAAFARALLREDGGSVLVVAAVLLPVLAIGSLGAMDYARLVQYRLSLQGAADAAALAATRELHIVARMPEVDLDERITSVATGLVAATMGAGAAPADTVATRTGEERVRVDLSADVPMVTGAWIGMPSTPVSATAIAQIHSSMDVCTVAMEGAEMEALSVNDTSRIVGPGCAVYSNSTHTSGMVAAPDARVDVSQICTAGGARGSSASYRPAATTDCPTAPDPIAVKLAAIPGLIGASCSDGPSGTLFDTPGSTETLMPGRYCHGVSVNGDVDLMLDPGIYVFDDSTFLIGGAGVAVKGQDIVLVFVNDNAGLIILSDADVRLSGRVSGPLAGMLMIAEPGSAPRPPVIVNSTNIHELVGTIYLPDHDLDLTATGTMAADSAFTVIMARTITLNGSTSLVLNRDYDATNVPKDDALKGGSGKLRLVR